MKFLKKVRRIEVKRAFVASDHITKYRLPRRRYLPKLRREDFLKRLVSARAYVLKRSEGQLDRFIYKQDKKRLKAYNSVDWYLGWVSTKEVGVWKRAGGLPLAWTKGSLAETAEKVAKAFDKNDKKVARRAKRAISRITDVLDIIEKEKYLYPIILQSGTRSRKKIKKMGGDIDDGSMRAIVLALTGKKKLKAYIGVPKKTSSKIAKK